MLKISPTLLPTKVQDKEKTRIKMIGTWYKYMLADIIDRHIHILLFMIIIHIFGCMFAHTHTHTHTHPPTHTHTHYTHTLIPLCLPFSVSWRVIVLYLLKWVHWNDIDNIYKKQVIFFNPLTLKCKPNWFVLVIFWYVLPSVVCYLRVFLTFLCCLCNLPYDCFSQHINNKELN